MKSETTKPKDQSQLEFLMLAEEAIPALETAVLAAREEVLLSFRVFDPTTKLRSPVTRRLGLRTWHDLIASKLAAGARFRVFLTDFEPILTADLHEQAWRNVAGFLSAAARISDADLEILCAQHEARFSRTAEWLFWPVFLLQLRKLDRGLRSGEFEANYCPGLSPLMTGKGEIEWRRALRPLPVHPVTHHQTFAIIDGITAILGGLDVNERRYDTAEHERLARHTWHDLSVKISDQVVNDLRELFINWWNTAQPATAPRTRLKYVCEKNGFRTRFPQSIDSGMTSICS